MKKNFFLKKSIDELSDKQLKDLDAVFGGVRDIPVVIYYPTGGGGPRCPYGFYWHSGTERCYRNGSYPIERRNDVGIGIG